MSNAGISFIARSSHNYPLAQTASKITHLPLQGCKRFLALLQSCNLGFKSP